MTTTLDDLQKMLSVDGYVLSVETGQDRTNAVITAGEGICSDCLVPKVVLTGMLATLGFAANEYDGALITIDKLDKIAHDGVLAELRDGDVFGEMSMLWHKKTCASVRASTPCVVLRLPREQFNEVIMTHPQILETLTTLSEQRSKQNDELKSPALSGDALL